MNNSHPIKQQIIPQTNCQYLESDFWEQRYSQCVAATDNRQTSSSSSSSNDIREWLGNYQIFSHIFRQNVPKSASILILGCGNSLLGEELFNDGYRDVHNIDISKSVIAMMAKHCDACSRLKWSVADCRDLRSFADQQFDVVIEKATIEVFFVGEKSPWSISDDTMRSVQRMANEIARVLKRSIGQFFSISFTAPHFRKTLFEQIFIRNQAIPERRMRVVGAHELGEHFHYYLYHLSNDSTRKSVAIFSYEPPKRTILDHAKSSKTDDACSKDLLDDAQDCEQQFLRSIELDCDIP